MSIFQTLFGTQAQPQQQQQQTQPGNLPAQPAQTSMPNNPNVPENQTQVQTPAEPASPMDQFSELWQSDPNQKATDPLIAIDPKQLADAARKTDFTKIVNPELAQKVAAGGEEAVQAMMQMLNQVSQGVYAQSAFAASKLVEQALAKAQDKIAADIPAHVKRLQVSDTLRSENPVFNHPAASPILGAIESQLTVKFPNSSASEITSMAKQYLESFANAVKAPAELAKQQEAAKAQAKSDSDWTSFF